MTADPTTRGAHTRPIPMIDLRAQHALLEKEILDGVASVLKSGRFILGEPVAAFERQLSALCGTRFGIGCNSGTDALWLALRALDIGPGDAVLCPAYSFFASAATIARLGASPVFCDIDPATFNLDPEDAIRRAESADNIRAVLSVDLFGRMCELGPLETLAAERGWSIVEDAAQAIGAVDSRGARPGERSRVACLSFYPTKNLGALGDAGGLVTSDTDLAARIESLRAHGEVRTGEYEEIGINSRLDALQATALAVKLPHLTSWTEARRELAAQYDVLFEAHGATPATETIGSGALPLATPSLVSPPSPVNSRDAASEAGQDLSRHSYHRYVVRVPAEMRDRLISDLREQGIASEIYYRRGLHQQPALAHFTALQAAKDPQGALFPESERATRESLALPLYPELESGDVERIVECVAGSLRA